MLARLILPLAASLALAGPAAAGPLEDAQTAFANTNDAEAIALYGQALADPAAGPDVRAAAHFGRGEVYALDGKHDDAIADFTAAIQTGGSDREKALAYYSRAESLARRNRLDEAVDDYGKSIALAPDQLGVRTARGTVLARMGKEEAALADFDAELARHPKYYRALTQRAVILKLPLPPNPEKGRR